MSSSSSSSERSSEQVDDSLIQKDGSERAIANDGRALDADGRRHGAGQVRKIPKHYVHPVRKI